MDKRKLGKLNNQIKFKKKLKKLECAIKQSFWVHGVNHPAPSNVMEKIEQFPLASINTPQHTICLIYCKNNLSIEALEEYPQVTMSNLSTKFKIVACH